MYHRFSPEREIHLTLYIDNAFNKKATTIPSLLVHPAKIKPRDFFLESRNHTDTQIGTTKLKSHTMPLLSKPITTRNVVAIYDDSIFVMFCKGRKGLVTKMRFMSLWTREIIINWSFNIS